MLVSTPYPRGDTLKRSNPWLASLTMFLICGGDSTGAQPPGLADVVVLPPGAIRTDAKGIKQVWVPPGCFRMGADDAAEQAARLQAPAWVTKALGYEDPAREVCLTAGYWIDQTEVTQAAFQAFVDDGGYRRPEFWSADGKRWLSGRPLGDLPVRCEDLGPEHPRVCVTWFEAEAYAQWRGGHLPSEAQWEFAARGPQSWIFPWGNEWDPGKANVVDSKGLAAVARYPQGASWVGALDMAGNAMEWVQDWLSRDYPKEKVRNDPSGPASGNRKIEKGGWWGSHAFVSRSSYKHFEDPPSYQDHHIGFRIVTPEAK